MDTMIFRFNVRLCGGGNDPCCKFSPKSASPKSCAGRRRFHPTVGSDMSLGSVVMATTHNRCPVGETWFGVFSSFLCSFFFVHVRFFSSLVWFWGCVSFCASGIQPFYVGTKDSPKNSRVSSFGRHRSLKISTSTQYRRRPTRSIPR